MCGRAMVQAVSRRPLTVETRVRFRFSPCWICGGLSRTGTGFSPSTSNFPCQYHSTGAPLQLKTKNKLIIFITGLYNKPQGCGACVASASGPFTTKKETMCGCGLDSSSSGKSPLSCSTKILDFIE